MPHQKTKEISPFRVLCGTLIVVFIISKIACKESSPILKQKTEVTSITTQTPSVDTTSDEYIFKTLSLKNKLTKAEKKQLKDAVNNLDLRHQEKEIENYQTNAADMVKQFEENALSGWDGSCPKLVSHIKKQLDDPSSFEHIETRYVADPKTNTMLVAMQFRAKNGFGALVKGAIDASLSVEGEVISISPAQ